MDWNVLLNLKGERYILSSNVLRNKNCIFQCYKYKQFVFVFVYNIQWCFKEKYYNKNKIQFHYFHYPTYIYL